MNSIPDDADFKNYLNPDSVKVLQGAKLEESLKDAKPGDRFQFVRNGYLPRTASTRACTIESSR